MKLITIFSGVLLIVFLFGFLFQIEFLYDGILVYSSSGMSLLFFIKSILNGEIKVLLKKFFSMESDLKPNNFYVGLTYFLSAYGMMEINYQSPSNPIVCLLILFVPFVSFFIIKLHRVALSK